MGGGMDGRIDPSPINKISQKKARTDRGDRDTRHVLLQIVHHALEFRHRVLPVHRREHLCIYRDGGIGGSGCM